MQLLLIISIVSALTASAYATSCYTCSSINQIGSCGDPFTTEGAQKEDCSKISAINGKPSTSCYKAVSEALGVKAVARGCVSGDMTDKKGCEKVSQGTSLFCEICTSDLCNGSNAISSMSVAIFMAIAAVGRFLF